jgi:putative transposase
VQVACRLLVVTESGYYAWRSRPPSAREVRHAWLIEQILAVHTASRGTSGARRVHDELNPRIRASGRPQSGRNDDGPCNRQGPAGGTRRPRSRHETPTATDLVDRMFTREAPNRLWALRCAMAGTLTRCATRFAALDIRPCGERRDGRCRIRDGTR